jgi:hypothetical protein
MNPIARAVEAMEDGIELIGCDPDVFAIELEGLRHRMNTAIADLLRYEVVEGFADAIPAVPEWTIVSTTRESSEDRPALLLVARPEEEKPHADVG